MNDAQAHARVDDRQDPTRRNEDKNNTHQMNKNRKIKYIAINNNSVTMIASI